MAESKKYSHDLVRGILIHLPSKSLLRFKRVEKEWFDIIKDREFVKEHGVNGGFKGILVTRENPRDMFANFSHMKIRGNQLNIEEELEFKKNRIPYAVGTSTVKGTPIVRGLGGIYIPTFFQFHIFNVSTQQVISLPKCRIGGLEIFHLGFDEVNSVHKVIRIFSNNEAEIFTVGVDTSWRTIEVDFPKLHIFGYESTSVKGSLFFELDREDKSHKICILNLARELFETLDVPNIILPFVPYGKFGQANDKLAYFEVDRDLSEVATGRNSYQLHIWTWSDGWAKSMCTFQSDPSEHRMPQLYWVGTLPSGDMLLAQKKYTGGPQVRMYKYDEKTNTLDTIELIEGMDYGFYNNHRIYYHEETILALGPDEEILMEQIVELWKRRRVIYGRNSQRRPGF